MKRRNRILKRLQAETRAMTEAEIQGALWAQGDLHATYQSVRAQCQKMAGTDVRLVQKGALGEARWEAVRS